MSEPYKCIDICTWRKKNSYAQPISSFASNTIESGTSQFERIMRLGNDGAHGYYIIHLPIKSYN